MKTLDALHRSDGNNHSFDGSLLECLKSHVSAIQGRNEEQCMILEQYLVPVSASRDPGVRLRPVETVQLCGEDGSFGGQYKPANVLGLVNGGGSSIAAPLRRWQKISFVLFALLMENWLLLSIWLRLAVTVKVPREFRRNFHSAVEKPIHADRQTEMLERVGFARVCVDIGVDAKLLEVTFVSGTDPNSGNPSKFTSLLEGSCRIAGVCESQSNLGGQLEDHMYCNPSDVLRAMEVTDDLLGQPPLAGGSITLGSDLVMAKGTEQGAPSSNVKRKIGYGQSKDLWVTAAKKKTRA
ncbi:hypothetical protein Nepgr_010533 [Nepenthes gracilis]|uniref:Uncharacterized protein n=1 Tax=Nepenthes gracilis TaxID=150966 RepID=A0AAD3SCL7_NEPGR|nr:hypothetical protein Nepgr_010533 [Nepenthes gracilis]